MKKEIVSVTQLRVGDVVYHYGGVFEIVSTGEGRGHIDGAFAYGGYDAFVGPSPVAIPVGRFVGGEAIPGYFGPKSKDWTFQGNRRALVSIRSRD